MMRLPGYTAERSLNYRSSKNSRSRSTLLSLPKSNEQIIPALPRQIAIGYYTACPPGTGWGVDLYSLNFGPSECSSSSGEPVAPVVVPVRVPTGR
jgi:hypothetical protein